MSDKGFSIQGLLGTLFREILNSLLSKKAENDISRAATTGSDIKPLGVKVVELGSGHSVQNDREKRRAQLRLEIEASLKFPGHQPKDGKTYCNFHTRRVAAKMGANLPQMMANDLHDYLEKNWRKDTGARAQAHAEKGGLAVASKKYPVHGHLAPIFPTGSMAFSGSWGKLVPYVGNVGKTVGVMSTSHAFPVKDSSGNPLPEPEYFLWGDV